MAKETKTNQKTYTQWSIWHDQRRKTENLIETEIGETKDEIRTDEEEEEEEVITTTATATAAVAAWAVVAVTKATPTKYHNNETKKQKMYTTRTALSCI